ncbi:MAG: hypothetical protein HC904_12355 [Blastochloris sp.]|nr:hypothetical protein [Blastochloris sp.]
MELKAIARSLKLSWREDASNLSPAHLRNRVRRGLIPYLKKLSGRDPVPVLLRLEGILREENLHWEEQLPDDSAKELRCAELRGKSVAWQRRQLRQWLRANGVSDLDFSDIEAVRAMLDREKPAKINLSQGRFARRRSGLLFLE